MKTWKKIAVLSLLIVQFGTIYGNSVNTTISTEKNKEYSINFDNNNYTVKTLTVNGQTIKYRAFEKIVYVKNPIDTKYEVMNFYVPEAYYEGKSIGTYNKDNAPIFFPNMVGGYMPAEPGTPGTDRSGLNPNAEFVALSKGYVVAEPGARGRTTQDANGKYTGKAPADIVDLKAAVRYLHFNDSVMPGDANKIISNGTSAGGALSALIGGSGNNTDYEPYLKEIGAANGKDDIFPNEITRDILEEFDNEKLGYYFWHEKKYPRGSYFTTRGADEGGEQEHQKAQEYREYAEKLRFTHPKTSSLLIQLAKDYEIDAEKEDLRNELQ